MEGKMEDRSQLGIIKDSNIKLKTGKTFDNYDKDEEATNSEGSRILSISEVKDMWKKIHGAESLREMESKPRRKVYLHELLQDSELIIPSLEIPPRNPELEKRINVLRAKLAQQEYRKMTKNVDLTTTFKPEDSIGYQLRQMNSGLIGVFQLVISLAAAFLFGFMGVEVLAGRSFDIAVNLLLGIMCAFIVGAAELYFLTINIAFSEDEHLKKKN